MQKSLYDQSTLTWSPQGLLYQVEYAMEAVNQGNLLIGVKSDTDVVLIGFKTAPNVFPRKIIQSIKSYRNRNSRSYSSSKTFISIYEKSMS